MIAVTAKWSLWVVFALLGIFLVIASAEDDCGLSNLTPLIARVVCKVESKIWHISPKARALVESGCLLGGKDRCSQPMRVPQAANTPPSPPPPAAKNKEYHRLSMIAEKLVPQTWWREGYANDVFLLSHNDTELPKKMIDISSLRAKKLKNINQCVTRQQFIRKSLDFSEATIAAAAASTTEFDEPKGGKCRAMEETVVKTFFSQWNTMKPYDYTGNPQNIFDGSDGEKLIMSAMEVMDYFYSNYGGIWTGCFKMERAVECRGALSAASWVVAVHNLIEISAKQKEFSNSQFVSGYLIASLGRGLLHGNSATIGDEGSSSWRVKLLDFVGLQGCFLKLYIDSFGKEYNRQLNKYIPMAFTPEFNVVTKQKFKTSESNDNYAMDEFEPIYTSLRNWMFTEASNLIDFGPYRPLIASNEYRRLVATTAKRRVLIDVGANGFFASPKYLLDSYAAYLPFTHAYMIEPEPHFSATIPLVYSQKYQITSLPIYIEVGSGSDTDIVKMLPTLVDSNDFVVLKFDVDPNRYAQGATMEWGFLFSLMSDASVASLIDELYIELHFNFPSLYWSHFHSNWEALDALRYLRSHGCVVHAWP